jgi:acyl-CoA reductase-like NAD-dependent aldehyde dehydrogenase
VSNAVRGVEFHEKGLALQLHKPNGFEEGVEMLKSETSKTREEINRTPLLNVKDMLDYLTKKVQQLEDIAKKLEDHSELNKEAKERWSVLAQIKVLNARIEEIERMIETFEYYAAKREKKDVANIEEENEVLEACNSSPSLGYADNQARL